MPTKQWQDTRPISWAYTEARRLEKVRKEAYQKLIKDATERDCLDLIEISLKLNT